MRYDAFISYSHAADGRLAPALQRGLQRLARPWYRLHALAVFRDETGLEVNAHLWASIVRALDASEWFILLCSPDAARSEWVGRELEYWLANGDPDRILLVLTEGDLAWDSGVGDFDPARSTALPPAVVGRFHDEPRFLDLRWAHDEDELDGRHARFRSALTELAAPVRGVPREALAAEDVRQHRRTMRLARGATTVLVVLLVIALTATIVAVQQRGRAQHASGAARREATAARVAARRAEAAEAAAVAQRRVAETEAATLLSRQLAASATNAFAGGQHDVGLLLAVAAERLRPTVEARGSLLAGLLAQPALRGYWHGLGAFPQAVQYSPNGSILAVGTSEGVQLWATKSGALLAHQPDPTDTGGFVEQLAFRPNGTELAVSGNKGVRVLTVATGKLVATQPELSYDQQGTTLAWSPDGAAVAVAQLADTKETITLFDVTTGKAIRSIDASAIALAPIGPAAIAFSPDGTLLASETSQGSNANPAGQIQIYDVRSGDPLGQPLQSHTGFDSAFRLTFGSNDTLTSVALGQADPVVHVWNLASRSSTLQQFRPPALDEHAVVVAVSPDLRFIASRSTDDGSVQIWNAETGAMISGPLPTAPLRGMLAQPATARFSPDDATLTVAADDATIRLFTTGEPQPVLAQAIDAPRAKPVPAGAVDFGRLGCNSPPSSVAFSPSGPATFSPDGSMYAFACRSFRNSSIHGALAMWNTRAGAEVDHWPVDTNVDFPDALAFSGDSKLIAVSGNIGSAGRGAVQLWNVTSGRPLDRQPPAQTGDVGVVAFSADGRTLAWTNDNRVVLWDVAGGRQVGILSPVQSVTAVGFSRDGKTVATVDPRGVTLWDRTSGEQIGTPMTTSAAAPVLASGAATVVNFNPAGDVVDEVIQPFSQFTLGDTGPAFAIRWNLQTDAWVKDACQIANRNLTRAEWIRYAGTAPYQPQCPEASRASS